MYKIGNLNDPNVFWSNDIGWVDLDSADLFSREQQTQLRLPLEGHWVPLWTIDVTQFARLIAECEACGIFDDRLDRVADSMDLELDEVVSIINRAQARWDADKAKV